MSRLIRPKPVIPAESRESDGLEVFISVVNFYENPLFIVVIAADEAEAQRLLDEMYAKAYERHPTNSNTFAEPGRFDSWWKHEYSTDIKPLYVIDPTQPGVYIFRGPNVDRHFR